MNAGKKETVKRLIYKRADFRLGTGDLQSLVDQAIKRFPAALDREWERPDDASLMLNTTRPNVGNCTCGVLVRFTRGHNSAILGLDPKAPELSVAQLAPPPLAGNKNTEFIENLGYFAIKKNEVVVVQSMAVRSIQISDYLNWLLRNHAALIPANDGLEFLDVSAAKFREHPVEGVKAFHFSSGIESIPTNLGKSLHVSSAKATVTPTGAEFRGLKMLLEGIGINIDAVPLNPLEAGAIKISVSVEINRKSFDEQSALLNMLGDIANRDIYDNEYELEFDNGLRLSGQDLFITKSIRLKAVGGMPDPFDLFKEMAEYLDELKVDRRLKG